jgi:hypothetical protein
MDFVVSNPKTRKKKTHTHTHTHTYAFEKMDKKNNALKIGNI